MTTTNGALGKILALAEEYARKAAALRMAAEILTGEVTTAKRNGHGVERMIAGAIELRAEQKGAANGNGRRSYADGVAVRDQLIALLSTQGEPMKMGDIVRHFAEQGIQLSANGVRHHLKRIPGVGKVGTSPTSQRWQLKPAAAEQPMPPAQVRKLSQKLSKHHAAKLTAPARAAKSRILAEILQAAGVALSTKELVEAARARGLTNLTGIHNYVKQGWIKTQRKNGTLRYTFVKLPPAAAATAEATDSPSR